MALPTNTYTRFTANTNVREDLIDKITMTNPEKEHLPRMAARQLAHAKQR